mmetsp:Transcript_27699/g.69777  ORF Transcript_27699/g.69777 Transcript_27699/m.69777 type:complete len:294 (-) Transcript_27699:297-1178(-)
MQCPHNAHLTRDVHGWTVLPKNSFEHLKILYLHTLDLKNHSRPIAPRSQHMFDELPETCSLEDVLQGQALALGRRQACTFELLVQCPLHFWAEGALATPTQRECCGHDRISIPIDNITQLDLAHLVHGQQFSRARSSVLPHWCIYMLCDSTRTNTALARANVIKENLLYSEASAAHVHTCHKLRASMCGQSREASEKLPSSITLIDKQSCELKRRCHVAQLRIFTRYDARPHVLAQASNLYAPRTGPFDFILHFARKALHSLGQHGHFLLQGVAVGCPQCFQQVAQLLFAGRD